MKPMASKEADRRGDALKDLINRAMVFGAGMVFILGLDVAFQIGGVL